MANYNRVVLIGNLTREPELKYTQGGTALCKFGLAISRKFGKGDEKKEEVCFVDITAFGKVGEVVANYCEKGKPVLVEGRLNYSTWEKDGKKNHRLDVVAENVQLLGSGKGGGKSKGGSSGERVQMFDAPKDEDDLSSVPF